MLIIPVLEPLKMKRMILAAFLALAFTVGGLAQEIPRVPDEVAEALQDRDYPLAIQRIEASLKSEDRSRDYLLFLKGRAFHFVGKDQQAIQVFQRFAELHPESRWSRHVRFALAISYARIGDHAAAEQIYRMEAEHLLSGERKEEIAEIYLSSADQLFSPKGEQAKPEYERALQFYLKGLEVAPQSEKAAQIQLRIIRCLQQLQKYDEAVTRLQAFLDSHPPVALAVEAHFLLGDCQFAQSNRSLARRAWQDLLALIPGDEGWSDASVEFRAKAAYRIAATHGLPSEAVDSHLSLGIAAIESFIKQFPEHELVDDAFLLMAESYQAVNRPADAEKVLSRFLKEPAYAKRDLIPEAQFLLGKTQASQKKFDDALQTWQQYLRQFPSHGRWSQAQRAIVNVEYLRAEESRERQDYAEARKAYLTFLAKYPLDERAQNIMMLLGEMQFQQEKYREALLDWQQLVAKYPDTNSSSQAQFRIASTWQEHLQDPEKALDEYRKLTWGDWQGQAQQAIKRLVSKQLVIRTDRVFRSNQLPALKLTSRNLETVNVRVYSIDLETYFRKMHLATGIEALDVSLIDPDHTFDFDVPDYTRYQQTELSIPLDIPEASRANAGVYVVSVSSDKLEATTMVLQSDLDVVVKASRHEVFVYAQNMLNGNPWQKVRLLISDGERILGEGYTNADGVFQQVFKQLNAVSDVRVFAVLEGHTASNRIPLSGLDVAQGLTPRGYVFTDRSTFRPGQLVNIRAIIRQVAGDVYQIEEGKEFSLLVTDPRGRRVWQQKGKLSQFGTLHDNFVLPESSVQGDYRIQVFADERQNYVGTFRVAEFQLQNVDLSVKSDRNVYYRGESITGTINATYYFGGSVAGKTVRYQLGDGRVYTAKTNDEGKVAFDLGTREFAETQQVLMSVEIPELNLQTVHPFFISSTGFSIAVETARDCFLSGESFPLALKTVDAAGNPQSQKLTVRVFRQSVVRGRVAEVLVKTWEAETGDGGQAQIQLQLDSGGMHLVRVEGKDRFGNVISGQHQLKISDQGDAVRLRILAEQETFRVGQVASIRVHWREAPAMALVTYQGARVLGYQLVKLETGENQVQIPLVGEHAPNFDLHIAVMADPPADKKDQLAVRLHQAQAALNVEQKLQVQIASIGDEDLESLTPGQELKLQITATDGQGRPVATEISLALVQEALIQKFGQGHSALQGFFRANRRLANVRTASSIDFSYRPTTQRIDASLLAEQERSQAEQLEDKELESLNGDALFGMNSVGDFRGAEDDASDRSNVADRFFMQQEQGQQSWFGLQQRRPSSGVTGQELTGGRMQQAMSRFAARADGESRLTFKQLRAKSNSVAALYPNGILNHVNLAGGQPVRDALGNDPLAQRAVLMIKDVSHETGYWNPAVVTDANGQATVEVTVPDISTAWQLTAISLSKDTLVGHTHRKLVAKKSLFGSLKLPMAITDGDQVQIPVTIHNGVLKKGKVDVTLRVSVGTRVTESVQAIEVKGQGEHELLFPLQIVRPDDEAMGSEVNATFELEIAAGEFEDRTVSVVPVTPKGLPVFASANGTATGDTTAWVAFDEGQPVKETTLQISLGASLHASLLEILSPNRDLHRHSVTSVTDANVSNLFAAFALHRLFSERRSMHQGSLVSLDQRIRAEIGQLVSSQREDGGWGWAGSPIESDRNVSARAIWALALARQAGYDIADTTWNSGRTFLRNQLSKTGNSDYESKAILLHGLAVAGDEDFALANRLHRNRPALSNSALVYLALAFNQMQRPAFAMDVLRVVDERNLDEVGTRRQSGQASLPWNHSGVELKALYALALQNADPRSKKVDSLVQTLLSARHATRWAPDKATGPATMAISHWLRGAKLETERYRIELWVNEQRIEEIEFDRDAQTRVIKIPATAMKSRGKQRIEFRMTGRGRFTYQCLLRGYVPMDRLKSTSGDWRITRHYEPAPLERDGKLIPRGFNVVRGGYRFFRNPLTQLPVGQRGHVTVSLNRQGVGGDTPQEHLEYLIVTEPIPAGAAVLEDTISGGFDRYEITPDAIIFYISNRFRSTQLSYAIHGYLAGEFSLLPTVVRDAYRPDQMAFAPAGRLKVIPYGQKSQDDYRLSPRELFGLGRLAYSQGRYQEAVEHLQKLVAEWKLKEDIEKETTEMLLDAHLEIGPAHRVVHYFEIVKEKYPELDVPYGKILKIGNAYHEMGEHERCYLIFRATVESSFMADSQIAGFLEQQGEPLRAVEFMNKLLQEYPPESYAAIATFDLAQQVYSLAETVAANARLREREISRVDLIRQAGGMLQMFLTAYPNDPAADQAAFSFANALLDLEQYEATIEACRKFVKRYPESRDVDGFWYTIGYCYFANGRHREALEVCRKVVDMQRKDPESGRMLPSTNRERAIYILGQVYHSLGEAANAIREYERVSSKFSDAKEAIEYFTRKSITLPEVTQFAPQSDVKIELDYRNIAECVVQVYRIDLMKFGLLKRNLTDVTSINLAGIRPFYEEEIELGDGKDYRNRLREVALPLADEGAYLIVCRGDGLHASGLVLISGLSLEVQEDPVSGRVRTTVKDAEGHYLRNVHIKVIGSCNDEFISGDTDLRGVFVADGIHGETTAMARVDQNRYAFFRGTTHLGAVVSEEKRVEQQDSQLELPQRAGAKGELLEGVRGRNSAIQRFNLERQQDLFYNHEDGVRVENVK